MDAGRMDRQTRVLFWFFLPKNTYMGIYTKSSSYTAIISYFLAITIYITRSSYNHFQEE